MEKNQYDLCIEVLHRLDKNGVLSNIIIIGSWCIPFYKDYFGEKAHLPTISTIDIDFLIPTPLRFEAKSNISELLKDLGFVKTHKGLRGYSQLAHPDLIVEFLVPERGRGSDKPYPLRGFGLSAQPLRFLDLLIRDTICLQVEGMSINLPHPANFALQKLIVSQRRIKPEKAPKDKEAAVGILRALIKKGEEEFIRKAFKSIPVKWQKKVIAGLEEVIEKDLLDILRY